MPTDNSDQSIFDDSAGGETPNPTDQQQTPAGGGSGDSGGDLPENLKGLEDLVGPGKQFKTAADLIKKIENQDAHIEKVQSENARYLETLGKYEQRIQEATGSEAVLEKLEELRRDRTGDTQQVDEASVRKLVDEQVNAIERQRSQKQNLEESFSNMAKIYGSRGKVDEAVARRSEELGISQEEFRYAAMTSPKAFMALMGHERSPRAEGGSVSQGDVNPDAGNYGQGAGPREGTWEWYENLRKTSPTKYWSKDIQKRLHQDYAKDPERFGLPS